jgi:alpha-beta hydrolase superfamily lysophospholipase
MLGSRSLLVANKENAMSSTVFGYGKLDRPEVLQALFHPRRDTTPPPPGVVDLEISVAEGIRLGARFFGSADQGAPTILFFHGNGEVVSDYDSIGPRFVEEGLSLLAVEYRGYGSSGGSPSVTALLADAHLVLQETQQWLAAQERTGPLFVMGRSLGSVPAIELTAAHQEELAGLIIESGFAFTLPLLLCLGVDVLALGLTEADGFKNQLKMAQVRKPTYILHAQHDQLIPVTSAEVLQAQCGARSKEFSMVPGADHNSIIDRTGRLYFEAIRRFVDKACQPARRRRLGVRG